MPQKYNSTKFSAIALGRRVANFVGIAALAGGLSYCAHQSAREGVDAADSAKSIEIARQIASTPNPSPRLCTAIRGNGELMLAHISSLAILTEHFGLIDGLAGGSSATYSMFLYESVRQNPALGNCSREPGQFAACSPEETASRASLLLKSIYAYIDQVKNSPEVLTAISLNESLDQVKAKFASLGLSNQGLKTLGKLSSSKQRKEIARMSAELSSLLNAPRLRSLINPRFLSVLVRGEGDAVLGLRPLGASPADLRIRLFRLTEARNMIAQFGSFKADSKNILFRPGVMSFNEVGQKIGSIANFYAGRGSRADDSDYDALGVRNFLNSCAARARNLSWFEFSKVETACTRSIVSLIEQYNEQHKNASVARPRIYDPIGSTLHILGISAIVEGGAEEFKRNSIKYLETPDLRFTANDFDVFGDVRFGYFGKAEDITALVQRAPLTEFANDFKMQHLRGFPNATWQEILNYSPAEPGLNELTLPAQLRLGAKAANGGAALTPVLPANDVSAAGWADLSPTIALKTMGCQNVIYITRREPESGFLRGVVTQIGATPTQLNSLYSLSDPNSSLVNSIAAADGVWCTDWNAVDLAAPNVVGLDKDINENTFIESSRLEQMRGLLLDPSEDFAKKLIASKHAGCGGTTPVPSPHFNNPALDPAKAASAVVQ